MGMLLLAALPAAAATTSNSTGRVTFGIEPASASGPDGRPNLSLGVTPGAVLYDHVAAVNYSSTPLSLQLYATDAVETSGGGFGLLPAATKSTGVGSWISLPPGSATVLVPAQTASGPGQIVVPITVRVPDKATPGDHVGGIVASLQTVGSNSSGQRIVLDQRIGTRVYAQVAGTLAPKLALTDLHATYQGTLDPVGRGRVKVSYVLSNTGNVDLAVDQSVAVSGLIGSTRQVEPAKVPLLLPGASLHLSAVVAGVLPQVVVHGTVTARPLALATSASPKPVSATTSTWTWAVPWTLLVLVVLIVAALVLAFRFRWRRKARRLAAVASEPAGVAEPTGVAEPAGTSEPAGAGV